MNFFGVPKNTTAPPDWLLSPYFTGFGSVQLSEHTPGGRRAQFCPCSARLCASFVPSLDCILIIETIRMPKSHISSLAHTCVFLKASLLPQHLTLKQFTCVMDTREVLVFSVTAAGFSPDSWESLALEVPNQFNSCSCHSSPHQHQVFGLCWQRQMGTGNTPNWCSFSHHTAGRAAPSCPEPQKCTPVCATGAFTSPGVVLPQHKMPQWNF